MTTKLKSVFWSFPHRLANDTRGVTLPLVAASITALIGFTGLGVETGLWYPADWPLIGRPQTWQWG